MTTDQGAITLLPSRVPMLADVFTREQKLVDDLIEVLERQRQAVGRDDIEEISASVEASHRLLATLGEARRRRLSLLRLAGQTGSVALSDLETIIPDPLDDDLRESRDRLVQAGARLAEAVSVNRDMLRRAIANGDDHLRRALGQTDDRLSYSPTATRMRTADRGGALVNRIA